MMSPAVVVATALLCLGACGVQDAGAAARVGEDRVSDQRVADSVDALQAQASAASFDLPVATTSTVQRLVLQSLVAQAATRQGVTVTDAELDKAINDAAMQGGGRDKLDATLANQSQVPRDEVVAFARTFLLRVGLGKKLDPAAADGGAKAGTKYLTDLATEIGVDIAPRFGTWSVSDLAIGPLPTDLITVAP